MEKGEIDAWVLGTLIIHGALDLSGAMGSYLSFCRLPESDADDLIQKIALITPGLHAALIEVHRRDLETNQSLSRPISAREHMLLSEIAKGSSNEEIAQRHHRSKATVRNQLHHLMNKLAVRNRTELVAKAHELSLFAVRSYPVTPPSD